PVLDPALARDRCATGPAAVAAPTSAARLRQVAVEALLAALRGVDVAVDGLVADGRPSVRFLLEPAGDLLRRQPSLSRPTTCSRRAGSVASFRRRCRRRRAKSWAFRGK